MHARSALSLSLSLPFGNMLDGWMDEENGRIGTVPHAGGLFRLRRAKATQPANLFSRAV